MASLLDWGDDSQTFGYKGFIEGNPKREIQSLSFLKECITIISIIENNK